MTQRNKNILLCLGFVAVMIIAYQFSFSETLHLKSEISRLEEENIDSGNLARLSANLIQREQFADSLLKKNNIKNISIQNNILEFLNRESEEKGIAITQFLEPHIFVQDEVKITSYQFTLRGQFKDMQDIVYQLEQNYNFGKISHVHFEKKRDYRRGRDYLECFVMIESFLSE
ncbi:hypothetical protein POV27_14300 [Aureisphaera galaxeae]|uniref:hypothetical protein n=1 Tax=Aureisphaera galaxeae TaxID=1538023 RepID=UPI0023503C0C|nr:hypothetical protein [Aureisphaera galaxeae]MDC8005229.1 hypothetical protein [Aureisphaera galaxeae]